MTPPLEEPLRLTAGLDESAIRALPKAEVHVHLEVTVNTDDPAPLGLRLEAEWSLCAAAFGWGMAELRSIARASIAASFAADELKASLLAELEALDR